MRGRMTQSVGEMRMEQAEYARDAKREESMCSFGGCMSSHGLRKGPKGWTGQYGGNQLCTKCYPKVVDRLVASLDEHGCAPWELEE